MQLLIPEANREFVSERLNCDHNYPIGINEKEQVTLDSFTFRGIPAAHNNLERDQVGRCKFMGFVVGFGPWKIYHSGDTLWYDGMEDLLRPFKVDVAILPINGNKPERRVAGNMNHVEAPRFAQAIGARLVIPCHYDMFTFNTADPADFARAAEKLKQPYKVLLCGEPWNSDQLP